MSFVALIAFMLLGAITFRVRGGLTEGWRWQLPGLVARATWALSCAAEFIYYTGAWLWAFPVMIMAYASTTDGLRDSIDMGRNNGTFATDFRGGGIHGFVIGACCALPLALYRYSANDTSVWWWVPMVTIVLWPTCYAIAWIKPLPTVAMHLGKSGAPPETAEIYFGITFALLWACAV